MVVLQKQYQLLIFSANLHAITELLITEKTADQALITNKNTYKLIATLIACGIDYKKNLLFIQSMNQDHYQLFYYLLCFAKIGDLKRMTQFKVKEREKTKNTSLSGGLLTYPCLMAADILLYNCQYVLVGKDQKQHLEFCKILLSTWQKKYKTITPFCDFEALTCNKTQKICALDNPKLKMSKSSQNKNSYISMFDNVLAVERKIKQAITDSDNKIYFDIKNKPGISNLITIYSELTNLKIHDVEKKYLNANYCEFKNDLIVVVNKFLTNFQEKYRKTNHATFLNTLLTKSQCSLQKISRPVVANVAKKLGMI